MNKNDIEERQQKIKKRLGILLALLIGLIIIIGGTYAFFTAIFTGVEDDTTISIGGGRLGIHMDGGNIITMNNIYPRAEAWETKRFTITGNNSTPLEMEYFLNLVVTENTFQSGSLKYTLTSENTSNTGIAATSITAQRGIPTGAGIHPIGEGLFDNPGNNMVHTYYLTFYFPSRGVPQNEDQGATFKAHVGVSGERARIMATEMMMERVGNGPNFLLGQISSFDVRGITFTNTNEVPENAVASWDVSANQDGGVMGWALVSNDNCQHYAGGSCSWTTDEQGYEIFIGANGGVLANPNSSGLFFLHGDGPSMREINVKWLDTRLVENASNMFSVGVNRLDLSSLDTSSITNMMFMFGGSNTRIFELNVTGWDTSSVTNMSSVFAMGCVINILGAEN